MDKQREQRIEERQLRERKDVVRNAFRMFLPYLPEGSAEKRAITWAVQNLDPLLEVPERSPSVVGIPGRLENVSEDDAQLYEVLERLCSVMDV